MRSTSIAVVVINDGRTHVIEQNEAANLRVARQWAELIQRSARNVDGSEPEVVVGSETVKSVRTGQKVGEELRRAGCRTIVMAHNVWDFPYLVWPCSPALDGTRPSSAYRTTTGSSPATSDFWQPMAR